MKDESGLRVPYTAIRPRVHDAGASYIGGVGVVWGILGPTHRQSNLNLEQIKA